MEVEFMTEIPKSWLSYYYAIKHGKDDEVDRHLKEGKDPRITLDGSLDSLAVAAKFGHEFLVRKFLKHIKPRAEQWMDNDVSLILLPAMQQALDYDFIRVFKVLLAKITPNRLPVTVCFNRKVYSFTAGVLYYNGEDVDIIDLLLSSSQIKYRFDIEDVETENNHVLLKKIDHTLHEETRLKSNKDIGRPETNSINGTLCDLIHSAPLNKIQGAINKTAGNASAGCENEPIQMFIKYACAFNRPDVLEYVITTIGCGNVIYCPGKFIILPVHTEILDILIRYGLFTRLYPRYTIQKILQVIFGGIISATVLDISQFTEEKENTCKKCAAAELDEAVLYSNMPQMKTSFLVSPAIVEMILPLVTPEIASSIEPGALIEYFKILTADRACPIPIPPLRCSWSQAHKQAKAVLKIMCTYDPLRQELVRIVERPSQVLSGTLEHKYMTTVLVSRRVALHSIVPCSIDSVSELLNLTHYWVPRYGFPDIDEIIRDAILAMAGTNLQIGQCLDFIWRTTSQRTNYFPRLIRECGLRTESLKWSLIPILARKALPPNVEELSRNGSRGNLSLASQCRLRILALIRKNQEWNMVRSSHVMSLKGKSVWDLVDELRSLPKPIRNYLKFEDMMVLYNQTYKEIC